MKTLPAHRTILNLAYTLPLILAAHASLAQQVTGTVLDSMSKAPIFQVRVTNGIESTFTDVNGRFSLARSGKVDTITLRKDGYKKLQQILSPTSTGKELILILTSMGFSLKEVQIRAKEQYRTDSIRMRNAFAKAFQYRGPGIQDVLMARSAENRMSLIRDPNSNSTASIVHVNLLQLGGFLNRKKNPLSKLKQQLLEDEKKNAIDQRFSRSKIVSLTSLKGDSLQMFMDRYRPKPADLNQKSDYELMLYITRCYSEFIREPEKSKRSLPLEKNEN